MDKRVTVTAQRPERRYMGLSGEQRSTERRHRLLDAGIRVAGKRGGTEIGIRDVCIEADLGPRYFYESFKCKDELVLAVYERLQANLIATVTSSMGDPSERCLTRLTRSIEAFLHFFEQNTHVRWILLFDSVVPRAPNKDSNWRLLSGYEAVLVDELKRGSVGRLGDRAAQAMACGLLGATIQLTVHWLVLKPGEPINETLAVLRFIYAAAVRSLPSKDNLA